MERRAPILSLVLVLWLSAWQAPLAHAGLIGNREALAGSESPATGESGPDTLAQRLVELGVEPGQARARVAALSPDERRRLAQRLEELPAGGDVAGALVFVFLVLLATDILGYTDVYPFVTRTVNGDK